MSFEVLHIWLRNQGYYLLSPLNFFGGVCIFVRGNSVSFLLHFLLYPYCPPPFRILTSFLSLSPHVSSPQLSPHCRVRGGFYWFGSWPCCGISTVLWKPTQKPWFETTVFYFAHRYKVSSAQPGLPLLDSLWGCLQDRRPGVSDGTGLEDSHNWDYWAVPSGGFFTEWPLKSRTPVEDCQLLSVAFSAVPQSGPHLCLSEGEGKGAPLFPRSIRESVDLF